MPRSSLKRRRGSYSELRHDFSKLTENTFPFLAQLCTIFVSAAFIEIIGFWGHVCL